MQLTTQGQWAASVCMLPQYMQHRRNFIRILPWKDTCFSHLRGRVRIRSLNIPFDGGGHGPQQARPGLLVVSAHTTLILPDRIPCTRSSIIWSLIHQWVYKLNENVACYRHPTITRVWYWVRGLIYFWDQWLSNIYNIFMKHENDEIALNFLVKFSSDITCYQYRTDLYQLMQLRLVTSAVWLLR
jgi:hypothetical protein